MNSPKGLFVLKGIAMNEAMFKEYLWEFRKQLLAEIKEIIGKSVQSHEKQWLKSTEVKKMLNVSHGKLQTMRKSGIIPFTKIGGAIYYSLHDITEMFEKYKK